MDVVRRYTRFGHSFLPGSHSKRQARISPIFNVDSEKQGRKLTMSKGSRNGVSGRKAARMLDRDAGKRGPGGDRRAFLKTGLAGLAAGTCLAASGADDPALAAFAGPYDGPGRSTRTLIRGGVVLSMDLAVGDFLKGDILIDGSKIVAVGPT